MFNFELLIFSISLRINSWYSVIVGRWRTSPRLTVIVLLLFAVVWIMIMIVVVAMSRHVIIAHRIVVIVLVVSFDEARIVVGRRRRRRVGQLLPETSSVVVGFGRRIQHHLTIHVRIWLSVFGTIRLLLLLIPESGRRWWRWRRESRLVGVEAVRRDLHLLLTV